MHKFKKIRLDEMERCYCLMHMQIEQEDYFFYASEANPGMCVAYHGKDFKEKEVVWDNIGGTMTMVALPNREGEFLAITEMYLKEQPSRATLVWAKRENGSWNTQPILHLPYIHRFDLYEVDGKCYFIGATITRDKLNKEDWRQPGQIYIGLLPEDLEKEAIQLKELKDCLFVNHGYFRGSENGYPCGYFGSEEGITKVTPPINGEDWKVERILEGRIGEIAVCDIDQDGKEEIITIEPFHGQYINVYHLDEDGYRKVYSYPNEADFAHALAVGNLNGKACFIVGVRKANQELALVYCEDDKYRTEIIDRGVGPANCLMVGPYLLSANHTVKEAAVYFLENE